MNKKLLGVVLSGVLCIGLLTGCDKDKTKESFEKGYNDGSQKVEEPKEEYTEPNIDDYKQETPEESSEPEVEVPETTEDNTSDIDAAYEIIKEAAEGSFGSTEIRLEKEDGMLVLYVNYPYEALMDTTEEQWNELTNNVVYCVETWNETLREAGNNTEFAMVLGDLSLDKAYLAVASDGSIVYNVIDDINTTNDNSVEESTSL